MLAILRRPEGLSALVGRRRAAFEPPRVACRGEASESPAQTPYEETLLPLADAPVPKAIVRKLLAAWKALRRVSVLNEEVAANVLEVLAYTLPDPSADVSAVGPLEIEEPPARAQATAAHPRAYRGTTYKPPKSRQPHARDLTGHLCVQSDEAQILARLTMLRAAAKKRRAAEPAEVADSRTGRTSGVLLAYGQMWPREAAARIPSLPAGLRRYFLYSQRGRSWAQVARLLELWWGLDLERDAELRLCVAVALNLRPGPECVEWCRTAAQIAASRRAPFIELLIETGAYEREPTPEATAQLVEADQLCSDAVWRHRMHAAFEAVAGRHDLAYLLDGFRLGNEFEEPWTFPVSGPAGTAAAIRPWVRHIALGEYADSASVWAVLRWQQCAGWEGLVDVLCRVRPEQLDPDTAYEFIPYLLRNMEDNDEWSEEKWEWAAAHAPRLVQCLSVLRKEYRSKFLRFQQEFRRHVWAEGLHDLYDEFVAGAKRLCAPPFRARGHSECAFTALLELEYEEPTILDNTSEATWEQLEAATFRRNDGWLVGGGLHRLVSNAGALTANAWKTAPRALLRCAKVLGSFHWDTRDALIRSFAKEAVSRLDPASARWPAMWRCVRPEIEAGVASPLSARLRAHLEGRRVLTPAQLARDRALLVAKWPAFQFEVLRQRALAEAARGLNSPDARDPAVEHALRMQPEGDENRRALRQLLRQRFAGRVDYANRHPLNRAWLAAHPGVNAEVWTRGFGLRGEVAGVGAVELRLETEPLEVLRMGSYFGTCLGLGGIYTHSAVAVALDVNKQVVYARTRAGGVIARQLLAISEADELVCFLVYPEDAGPGVRKMFREYDVEFARRLGLPMYKGASDSDDYVIRNLVSHDFWDDGAWDGRSAARSTSKAK